MDYSPKVSRSSPGLLTTSERHQDVLVNQDGAVYEKDLGESTESQATAMTAFDPDSSWQVVP
jgi:hypothetical protein